MDTLEGRTAVVIGGGSGIGRGTALGLAAAGASVVVADIERDPAETVAAEIAAAGGTALAHRVDGTDRDSLTELRDTTVERFGAVHVLSNNVGVIIDRPLDEADETEWAWAIEFNLMSIVRAGAVFLPALRANAGTGGEATHSHIVNTASMAALVAVPPAAAGGTHIGLYVTTKHAILGYCEMLRAEVADDGIGVSVLCPGLVQSNLSATSARNRPERHGGPIVVEESSDAMPGAMTQEEVGPIVVAGILGNRLHILTHPEAQVVVDRRHRAQIDDFEFFRRFREGS